MGVSYRPQMTSYWMEPDLKAGPEDWMPLCCVKQNSGWSRIRAFWEYGIGQKKGHGRYDCMS